MDNAIHWLETQAKFARPAGNQASNFAQGPAIYAAKAREWKKARG